VATRSASCSAQHASPLVRSCRRRVKAAIRNRLAVAVSGAVVKRVVDDLDVRVAPVGSAQRGQNVSLCELVGRATRSAERA